LIYQKQKGPTYKFRGRRKKRRKKKKKDYQQHTAPLLPPYAVQSGKELIDASNNTVKEHYLPP
jgi:hypothetical protein